jgi:hypothetical protein
VSPADARVLLLCAELERDWNEVLRHRTRAMSVDPAASEYTAAFVGLSIDHAYQAFESFLQRLERGLGLPVRTGPTWHAELLRDAALEIAGLRPAIVPAIAAARWVDVMEFRHFLRHAYGTDLDPTRLTKSRANLDDAVEKTSPVIALVIASMRETDA